MKKTLPKNTIDFKELIEIIQTSGTSHYSVVWGKTKDIFGDKDTDNCYKSSFDDIY